MYDISFRIYLLGRDLGELLHQRVAAAFSKDNTETLDTQKCDRAYKSVLNLTENVYGKQYYVEKRTAISNFTIDEIREVTSNEGIKYLEENAQNWDCLLF